MMMNPFKYIKLRRDWRLVKTIKGSFIDENERDIGDAFYYLYENGLHHRKVKHKGSGIIGDSFYKSIRERHPLYLGKICPWIDGRYDPKIPSYETIKSKEFKDALKGKMT